MGLGGRFQNYCNFLLGSNCLYMSPTFTFFEASWQHFLMIYNLMNSQSCCRVKLRWHPMPLGSPIFFLILVHTQGKRPQYPQRWMLVEISCKHGYSYVLEIYSVLWFALFSVCYDSYFLTNVCEFQVCLDFRFVGIDIFPIVMMRAEL